MSKKSYSNLIAENKEKGTIGYKICKAISIVIGTIALVSILALFVWGIYLISIGVSNGLSVGENIAPLMIMIVIIATLFFFTLIMLVSFIGLLLVCVVWGIYYLGIVSIRSYQNKDYKKEYKEQLDKKDIEVKDISRISKDEIKETDKDIFDI